MEDCSLNNLSPLVLSQPGGIGTPVAATVEGKRAMLTGLTFWGMPSKDDWHVQHANQLWEQRDQVLAALDKFGNINLIRMRLDATDYLTEKWVPKREYLERFKFWADAFLERGWFVELCWWDAMYAGGNLPHTYKEYLPAMRDAYAVLPANHSRIIVAAHNEPNNVKWDQWLKIMKGTLRYWRNALEYNGPFVAGTPYWCQADWSDNHMIALERFDAKLRSAQHYILFDLHAYSTYYGSNVDYESIRAQI